MSIEEKKAYLNIDSSLYQTRLSKKYKNRKKFIPSDPRQVISFIPGVVLEVFATPGMMVVQGQDLMTVDAMKMKNKVKSHVDGKVKSVAVGPGSKVGKGSVLLELE